MEGYIRRQDAIDAICKEFMSVYCWNCANQDTDNCEDCHRKYMNWGISRETVESVINDLPSAQKKGEWIPCSERLPDNDRQVLVSIRWDKNDTDLDEVSIAEYWESDQWGNLNDKVTAWAELPAPYTESEVEDGKIH